MFRLTVTAVSLSFALGCGSGSKPDAKGDPKTTDPKKQAQGLSTPGVPDGPEAVAQKFVADFFAALKAKTATPDQLTPEFKKVVAPPFGGEPIGFADAKAKDFLAKWATVTADPPKAEVAGDVAFAAGKPGPGGRVLMRLRKDADGWKVDWLSNGPATASVVKLDGGVDTAGVQFAAAAFTDAALTKDYTLAAALMSDGGMQFVAPAVFSADKARGYNLGLFKEAIASAFGQTTQIALAGTSREGDTATVTLELTAGDKKTPLMLTLVREKDAKPGAWLVDRFEAK